MAFSQNQIIKGSYHLFASIFLFYLLFLKNINITIKIILLVLIIFHLYDSFWFYNNDGNAPI
jgi:hypothetical protein